MEVIEKVNEFLKSVPAYYLATTSKEGARVRPFGTSNIFEGKLYIQTSGLKEVGMQIKENPNVEICAIKNGVWMRLRGELVLDQRREAKVSMLDAYPSLKGMYSADDENTWVLYFKNATVIYRSMQGLNEEYHF